jgi:hypothetical protein
MIHYSETILADNGKGLTVRTRIKAGKKGDGS